MENITLSIEQMKELKGWGVDTSKASLFYVETFYTDGTTEYTINDQMRNAVDWDIVFPTFTYQEVCNLIMANTFFWLELGLSFMRLYDSDGVTIHMENSNDIQGAFNMLKYCVEKGYCFGFHISTQNNQKKIKFPLHSEAIYTDFNGNSQHCTIVSIDNRDKNVVEIRHPYQVKFDDLSYLWVSEEHLSQYKNPFK